LLQPAEKAWRDQLPPPSVGTSGELPQYTSAPAGPSKSPKPAHPPVSWNRVSPRFSDYLVTDSRET